jgi:hypothetical protein
MMAARVTVDLRIWELPLVETPIIESNLSLRNNLFTFAPRGRRRVGVRVSTAGGIPPIQRDFKTRAPNLSKGRTY